MIRTMLVKRMRVYNKKISECNETPDMPRYPIKILPNQPENFITKLFSNFHVMFFGIDVLMIEEVLWST